MFPRPIFHPRDALTSTADGSCAHLRPQPTLFPRPRFHQRDALTSTADGSCAHLRPQPTLFPRPRFHQRDALSLIATGFTPVGAAIPHKPSLPMIDAPPTSDSLPPQHPTTSDPLPSRKTTNPLSSLYLRRPYKRHRLTWRLKTDAPPADLDRTSKLRHAGAQTNAHYPAHPRRGCSDHHLLRQTPASRVLRPSSATTNTRVEGAQTTAHYSTHPSRGCSDHRLLL
jgi:hypothetical protein